MTTINQIKAIFINKDLFDQSLTHRSWINENPGVRESNERLEFLGDAVLEFVVSSNLYKKFPKEEEGYLTALRANIVNTTCLGTLGEKLGVGPHIFLSKGEADSGGAKNASLLADTIEAIIGAIYIDQGLANAERFIHENLLMDVELKAQEPLKDAKSRLQELVQAKSLPTPRYKVVNESGPDHSKIFDIEVWVDGRSVGVGSGNNKSEAEQRAAEHGLEAFSQRR